MRRTNCRDDEVLQELRIGAGAGDRFRRKWPGLVSRSLIVDQRAFRLFIRAENVAYDSDADLFTDPVGRASIFCSNRNCLDGSTAQRAETFTERAGCGSARILSATANSTLADESVIRITTAGATAGIANRIAYFRSGAG